MLKPKYIPASAAVASDYLRSWGRRRVGGDDGDDHRGIIAQLRLTRPRWLPSPNTGVSDSIPTNASAPTDCCLLYVHEPQSRGPRWFPAFIR
jgi:hypothetical protein